MMNRTVKILIKESPLLFFILLSACVTGLVLFQNHIERVQNTPEQFAVRYSENTGLAVSPVAPTAPMSSNLPADNPYFRGIKMLENNELTEGVTLLESVDSSLFDPLWANQILSPWGEALITLERFDDALDILTSFEEAAPSARREYLTALTCYYLKQSDNAVMHYQNALAILPDYYAASYNLGSLYLQREQFSLAVELLETAVRSSGGIRKAKAYHNQGIAYTRLEQFSKAVECYENAINLQPDENRARLNLAQLYSRDLNNPLLAEELYNEVLRLDPRNSKAFAEYTELLIETDREQQAHALLIEYDKSVPDRVENRLELAELFLRLNRDSDAERHLNWVISHGDGSSRGRFLLGKIQYRNRQYLKAAEHYQRAVELENGHYPEALNNLGLSYAAMGYVNDAIEAYEQSIAIQPDYQTAHYNLGLAWMELEENNRAVTSFNASISLNPEHSPSWYNIAIIYSRENDNDKAIETYNTVLDIDPQNRKARLNLANRYKARGEYEKAVEHYTMITSIHSSYTTAWYNLALCYKEMNEHEAAEAAYLEAIRIDPGESRYYSNLAILYTGMGRFEDAEFRYLQAIENDESHPVYPYNLGVLYEKSDQTEKALEMFRTAVSIDHRYTEGWIKMGELYRETGLYSDAVSAYTVLIELDPDHGEYLYNRGKSYFHNKEYDSAEKDFISRLEMEPDDPWGWYYLGKTYQKTGSEQLANQAFLKASSLDSGMDVYILGRLNDEEDSRDLIMQLADQTEEPAHRLHLAELLLKQEQFTLAETEFRTLVRYPETKTKALILLTDLLMLDNRGDEAADLLESHLSGSSGDFPLYLKMIEIHQLNSSPELLRNTLSNALAINPDHQESLILMGELLYSDKDYAKAIDHFMKAHQAAPESSDLMLKIGKSYYRSREYEESLLWFDRHQEISQTSWSSVWQARALARLNQEERAIAIYRQITVSDPDFIQSYIGLGDIYKRRSEYRSAFDWYARALEIDPLHSATRKKADQMQLHITY